MERTILVGGEADAPAPGREADGGRGAGEGGAADGGGGGAAPPAAATQDGYLDRILKLIPAEIVAFYLFCQGIIQSQFEDDPSQQKTWLYWIAAFAFVLTPFYYRRVAGVWRIGQVALTTLAFVVWVFALGGPFRLESWYQPFIASLVLAGFVLLSGLFQPTPQKA